MILFHFGLCVEFFVVRQIIYKIIDTAHCFCYDATERGLPFYSGLLRFLVTMEEAIGTNERRTMMKQIDQKQQQHTVMFAESGLSDFRVRIVFQVERLRLY